MNRGINLRELANKVNNIRQTTKDYIAPTDKISMTLIEENKVMVPVLELFQVEGNPKRILPLAHDQIGGYLGIPGRYYDRMLKEHPDLLTLNVNTWFKGKKGEENDKRMVRTVSDNARAFLSNRYQRIDNWQVMEVALPILMQVPDIQIVSCECTDRRLYIQATTPRIAGEVKKGDVVQAGVVISNSEVGCGSVSVASLLYRLVCLNGMIGQDKFRQNHIGRAVEDSETLWSDDTRRTDDNLVLLKVRDMVTAAINEERFVRAVNRMKELTEVEIKGANVSPGVEVLAQKIGASDTEKNGIMAALIEGKDLSAWGIINAVTAQAHSTKDYDRSVELEQAGGMMLNFSAADWKSIVTATEKPARVKATI